MGLGRRDSSNGPGGSFSGLIPRTHNITKTPTTTVPEREREDLEPAWQEKAQIEELSLHDLLKHATPGLNHSIVEATFSERMMLLLVLGYCESQIKQTLLP